MGRGLEVDWQESADQLKHLYQKEVHPRRRTRLQALWQLRQGKEVLDVVDSTGASLRSVYQWLQWYRQDGPRLNRRPETGGGPSCQGQETVSKPTAAKDLGGQGATGPVPNGVGCNRVGPGSLGGALHL